MLDEVQTLLARLCVYIERGSHAPLDACLEYSVVLGVDSHTWMGVVVGPGLDLAVR